MASRSWYAQALVLSLSAFGEGHKSVTLFVRLQDEAFILRAALFGGAQSKLRGLVIPYTTGRVWVYSNPRTSMHKIVDFSVTHSRVALRDSIVRVWCAAICVDIIEASKGTISWTLVTAFLDGISLSSDGACKHALLRFLWRVLIGEGVAPNITSCSRCATQYAVSVSGVSRVAYLTQGESFVCAACAAPAEHRFELNAEAWHFLNTVKECTPRHARALVLSQESYCELKQLLFCLITKMSGKKLKTLEHAHAVL
ncbi:recombination protein O [Treponema pallidum subsp. pallidum str. Sea 81-4]|nr:DNA repair protein RecO [Treponema pallidum subsp. pallidum str. Chicago]AHN67303.1 recombination protein O [Treponema pallidum subsp. pallidum str. Sea 81-4]ANA42325.1 recombination protein O [Treponema pallidum subsp. pallidum]